MKFLKLIPFVLLVSGCQAWVTPITEGSKDGEAWIFVEKPAGDFQRNGIYHCSSENGTTTCQKATVKN